MPASVLHPTTGYISFCVVKLVGYSLAARWIARRYDHPEPGRISVVAGSARTLIGMAVGAVYYHLFSDPSRGVTNSYGYLAGLIPVRFCEWWLLIWLFYDRRLLHPKKGWLIVILCTLLSFLLDVPAAIGWFITAGFSVC